MSTDPVHGTTGGEEEDSDNALIQDVDATKTIGVVMNTTTTTDIINNNNTSNNNSGNEVGSKKKEKQNENNNNSINPSSFFKLLSLSLFFLYIKSEE